MSRSRQAATAAIIVVATVAGWASYQHITTLSLALHQPGSVAYVLAFAVDGLITIGSLALLNGMKAEGWTGIIAGLVISLYANVESGVSYGVRDAIWAGVPSVSFFLATFILERWITTRARTPGSGHEHGHEHALVALGSLADVLEAQVALMSARRAVLVAEAALEATGHVLERVTVAVPVTVPASAEPAVPEDGAMQRIPGKKPAAARAGTSTEAGHVDQAVLDALRAEFAAELVTGKPITLRAVKERMHVGTPNARRYLNLIDDHLRGD